MDQLDLRLRLLYASLGKLQSENVPIQITKSRDEAGNLAVSVGFAVTPHLDVVASVNQLLNDIGCLKDHFRAWCKAHGKAFDGEKLINSNRDVAVIHDLWNISKHAEYNRPSRSGLEPKVGNYVSKSLFGLAPDGRASLSITGAGEVAVHGRTRHEVDATIQDKDAKQVGRLRQIAARAIAAWEQLFVQAGVKIPRT